MGIVKRAMNEKAASVMAFAEQRCTSNRERMKRESMGDYGQCVHITVDGRQKRKKCWDKESKKEELTYAEALEIVENTEIVNEGTEHAFVKGCYGEKYRNARERLACVWLDKELRA